MMAANLWAVNRQDGSGQTTTLQQLLTMHFLRAVPEAATALTTARSTHHRCEVPGVQPDWGERDGGEHHALAHRWWDAAERQQWQY